MLPADAYARTAVVMGLVAGIDQVSKAVVSAQLPRGDRLALAPGLDLTNVGNTGVAFGVLSGGGPWLVALTFVALALLVAYFVRHATRRLAWLPVGAVMGGALGNLVDRAREGAVIDFIDPVAWPAFNIADTAIVLGVLGLVVLVESSPRVRARPVERRPPPWPEPRER